MRWFFGLLIAAAFTIPSQLRYNANATGSVSRPIASKEGDVSSIKDYCGDPVPADATTCIQTAFNDAANNNRTLFFPKGIYNITAQLTITGNQAGNVAQYFGILGSGDGFDATSPESVIKWTGADAPGSAMIKVDGVGKVVMERMALVGNGHPTHIFWATKTAGGVWSPFGWSFINNVFEWPLTGGDTFFIDGTTQLARFTFMGCTFIPHTGSKGFYSTNQNSLNHSFIGSWFFGPQLYGIHINGGSFNALGTEFTGSETADIYLQINQPITLTDTWSEQSKQFLIGDNRTQPGGTVTIIGGSIASYPWAYWKLGNGSQPTNDYTQWATITWDRDASLNLVGAALRDPFLGVNQGGAAPQVSSLPTVIMPNGRSGPIYVNNIGSMSTIDWVAQDPQFFVWQGVSASAVRTPTLHTYRAAGTVGGAITVNAAFGSMQEYTINATTTLTMNTSNAAAGDIMTVIVKQDGTGGRAASIVGVKFAGGVPWTPTTTANDRSHIVIQYDGTQWNELSRGLNLNSSGPAVIALTAQTANLAATNVYAAAPAGTYRVCVNARTTTSGTGTTANVNIIWTDEGGVKTDALGTFALNSVTVTGQINKCEYIHAAAATNIQVSVTGGTYGTSVYALDATAERLN